ncbi:uncharacterized protein LOC132554153 [Ylistrum balloti]|uniref:uncharacterized protein LOC132554153 n=1 Tax=Ylistrum balloti TaxID=509963 RepID=UPI002905CC07|nr:uncharacterized protein LOC132554153 [Ylistrum balloti]
MLHRAKKDKVVNIRRTRQEVYFRRIKLKAELDDIADKMLAELSTLEKELLAQCNKICQHFEKKTEELTRLLEKNAGNVSQKESSFADGSIDRDLLKDMFGVLRLLNYYEKIKIDSNHVQRLSRFTVTQQKAVFGICPVDDSHAWLSIHEHKGLVLVDMDGVVTEEVELNFRPYTIAMIGTTDVLITSNPCSTFVYKLSLHNKQVTTFADTSPHQARDISNKIGEVLVCIATLDIVVLNQSGTIVRTFYCWKDRSFNITSLSSGRLGVVVGDWGSREIIITDESYNTVKQRWTGELDNGRTARDIFLRKMSCDEYDRLFIPDYRNNQVYVLPSDEKQAKCLLDQKHGVVKPTAVSVDKFGNVWIGCMDGTVHVMLL